MKVLIDNGHGENTKGKRSPDGKLREYAWTREIADMLVLELGKMGIDAERVVKETIDVPLSERCRRVNEICGRLGTSNVILISIHCNAAGSGIDWMQARGWSAYTSKGSTKADVLASCLYASLLTENFFQDNKEDVEFLLSADGKARIVKAHAIGIANYLKV